MRPLPSPAVDDGNCPLLGVFLLKDAYIAAYEVETQLGCGRYGGPEISLNVLGVETGRVESTPEAPANCNGSRLLLSSKGVAMAALGGCTTGGGEAEYGWTLLIADPRGTTMLYLVPFVA